MKRIMLICVMMLALLMVGCESSVSLPPRDCEGEFDDALAVGVPYVDALGDYTQCLIDEGRVLGLALDVLLALLEQIGNSTWLPNFYSTNRH